MQEEFRGEESLGENYISVKYLQEESLGEEFISENMWVKTIGKSLWVKSLCVTSV